ncbi:hypothetical protein [Burkholderia stabilis]|uniref:hypothetical protein n=1 Tax=Burkholderia stabilis TaxID=95485 RepID=UPI001FC879D6|nr:hypothetical protein [Burkholderia stabilis]
MDSAIFGTIVHPSSPSWSFHFQKILLIAKYGILHLFDGISALAPTMLSGT